MSTSPDISKEGAAMLPANMALPSVENIIAFAAEEPDFKVSPPST